MRLMADGSEVMFVGPYANAGARELALFAIVPDSELTWLRITPYSYRYDGKCAPHDHLEVRRARRARQHVPDLARADCAAG